MQIIWAANVLEEEYEKILGSKYYLRLVQEILDLCTIIGDCKFQLKVALIQVYSFEIDLLWTQSCGILKVFDDDV